MANPTPDKKSPGRLGDRLWFLVLAASLLANAHFYFNKNDKADQVLASAEGRSFRWKDVSEKGQKTLQGLDATYYLTLKAEAERWAENFVLPREARLRGLGVSDLLNAEVHSKAKVGPEEVQRRYALSPASDRLPWPDVLKQIEAELSAERAGEIKTEYLKGLFAKHGVRFDLKAPASLETKEPPARAPARFPVYTPPSIGQPPSRGPQDAPILLEIYSDFHCPFSKRFALTLNEVEKGYPGKLRVVFHHFPLPIHPQAGLAHEASACAQEQGKFWEFHDRLMASAQNPDKGAMTAWAAELGMNAAAFDQCFSSSKHRERIRQETAAAGGLGVRSTPTFFVNGRLVTGAVPSETLKSIFDWHLKPEGRYPGPVQQNPSARGQAGGRIDPSKQYSFPNDWLKKGPSRGPENAPVTIVEFMDYNCPFCQRGAATLKQVEASYPGKIRVIAKNFPLSMHPNAAKNAEAVLCAHEQGKFWEFRDELFGAFWGRQSDEDMKAIAKSAGLDPGLFSACFDSSKMKSAVDEDVRVLSARGTTGTPTFFVNGSAVVGAQPVENFRKIIDEKLAGK